MRVLLDTNIIIHREASTVVNSSIGILFNWLDRLKHEKCVHPLSIDEIRQHSDPKVTSAFEKKIQSYSVLKTVAADQPAIVELRRSDVTANDTNDTTLLNELVTGRVDAIITEDRGIHRKAAILDVSTSVFSIDSFLEKATAENPELADYKVLSVKKVLMGNVDLTDPFFDSFRSQYDGFDKWFNRKADEAAYICTADGGEIIAFLYVKREGSEESYADIAPPFWPAPGSDDTELGVLMGPEVDHGEAEVHTRVQA